MFNNPIIYVYGNKKFPFKIPEWVRWIAMDQDGCYVGFKNYPSLMLDKKIGAFWVDMQSDTYISFGKYPNFNKRKNFRLSLEKITHK